MRKKIDSACEVAQNCPTVIHNGQLHHITPVGHLQSKTC
jgi:hypothetical protein